MFRERRDLDPAAMTDRERRDKRCFEAAFAFETMPWPPADAPADSDAA